MSPRDEFEALGGWSSMAGDIKAEAKKKKRAANWEHEKLTGDILVQCSGMGFALSRNVVGQGFLGRMEGMLRNQLANRHPAAWAVVQQVMNRNRVRYGLGVGSPDLVVIRAGLEIKTGTGRLSPKQKRWHNAARANGTAIAVVRSVDDAREFLTRVSGGVS